MQTPGADPEAGRQDEPPNTGLSRRGLMRSAAGVGAATVAAGFLAGALAEPAAAVGTDHAGPADTHAEPIVAHVHDARTGQVDLFVGTRHIRVNDHELAARLSRAIR
jgi:hypothetical protein